MISGKMMLQNCQQNFKLILILWNIFNSMI